MSKTLKKHTRSPVEPCCPDCRQKADGHLALKRIAANRWVWRVVGELRIRGLPKAQALHFAKRHVLVGNSGIKLCELPKVALGWSGEVAEEVAEEGYSKKTDAGRAADWLTRRGYPASTCDALVTLDPATALRLVTYLEMFPRGGAR